MRDGGGDRERYWEGGDEKGMRDFDTLHHSPKC